MIGEKQIQQHVPQLAGAGLVLFLQPLREIPWVREQGFALRLRERCPCLHREDEEAKLPPSMCIEGRAGVADAVLKSLTELKRGVGKFLT